MADFATISQKSKDPTFQARLAVAVTEHCRFTLGRAKGGSESDAHFEWSRALAHSVLRECQVKVNLERMGRLCLLPQAWGTFDPDDDAALQSRAAERFAAFSMSPEPA